ncbi:MAG: hypothetical protein V2I34_10430, partial [Bacteroidales bacterium]|nr:hypothetical protein [Bacteroidales bacterium]
MLNAKNKLLTDLISVLFFKLSFKVNNKCFRSILAITLKKIGYFSSKKYMRITIIGYGRMGREVENIALEKGHEI